MKQKLSCLMLVDDSEADNFLHGMVLEEVDCADTIKICKSASEALEYLASQMKNAKPFPELMFLDINMPRMSGWDFLEEYEKLPEKQKGDTVICMLTTSISGSDFERSREYPVVRDYLNKPLTAEMLNQILLKYFKNRM